MLMMVDMMALMLIHVCRIFTHEPFHPIEVHTGNDCSHFTEAVFSADFFVRITDFKSFTFRGLNPQKSGRLHKRNPRL